MLGVVDGFKKSNESAREEKTKKWGKESFEKNAKEHFDSFMKNPESKEYNGFMFFHLYVGKDWINHFCGVPYTDENVKDSFFFHETLRKYFGEYIVFRSKNFRIFS